MMFINVGQEKARRELAILITTSPSAAGTALMGGRAQPNTMWHATKREWEMHTSISK